MKGIDVDLLLALLGGDFALLGDALIETLGSIDVLSERSLKMGLEQSRLDTLLRSMPGAGARSYR